MKTLPLLPAILAFATLTACSSLPNLPGAPGSVQRSTSSTVPRTQLWDMTQKCIATAGTPDSPPACIHVERAQGLDHGYLVLKDMKGTSHFLVIPTVQVTGIEDAKLLRDNSPNYWKFAWDQREQVSLALGKKIPDAELGLAANPPFARSQDQLHIHIDCVKPDVLTELNRQRTEGKIGSDWSAPMILGDATYEVRFLARKTLKKNNPFKVLAKHLQPGDQMGLHTLVVVRAEGAGGADGGFYLIDGHRAADDTTTPVHGEALLDLNCQQTLAQ